MSEYIQIGQILKNYRLKRDISLEKISNKTKISIQNLTNIEEGNFHLIAGKFYQKSFIKLYAKVLRISDKKILSLFDNASNYQKANHIEKKDINFEKNKEIISNKKIPTVPIIFFALVGLLTIFLFNFMVDSNSQNSEQLATIPPKSELKIAKIENDLVNEIEKIKPEIPLKQTNIKIDDLKNYGLKNNGLLLEQIVAKEDVWIEIKDYNENIIISAVLKKDESFNLPRDKKDLKISASNAGALFVKNENNNQTGLGPLGTPLSSVNLNSLITNH